jgi:hypothetical protein
MEENGISEEQANVASVLIPLKTSLKNIGTKHLRKNC